MSNDSNNSNNSNNLEPIVMVDDRVGSAELQLLIRGATKQRLDYGDIAIWAPVGGPEGPVSIGIERKTISDLVNSMNTGRFVGHQLIGLMDSYDVVYLLVEGRYKANSDGLLSVWSGNKWRIMSHGSRRFTYKEVFNFLNSMTVICGVKILNTETIGHTAQAINSLVLWWSKPWNKHQAHLQPSKSQQVFDRIAGSIHLIKPGIVHRVAKEITGVGWDKGREVAEHFNTVLDLALATEDELRMVDGIGPTLARNIIKEMRGE
jgi:ERCC4-type nuclease